LDPKREFPARLADRSRALWPALGLLLVLATALRLHNTGLRSMSHPELFVPGLTLPAGLSVPAPRLDLFTTVKSTLSSDTHPPGYYVMMWFVTKAFGQSTWAIRLPSVLFGVASVGLLFWLGALVEQRTAGLIAAALLACNGYHVFWSRVARMYSLECFLGLLGSILLLLLARSGRRRRALETLYALLMLFGLTVHIFLWLVLATHMLWVFANSWTRGQPRPRLLDWQLLVAVLGSPLVAFAAYQSGNPVATLSTEVARYGREFVGFAFLFPSPRSDTSPADPSVGAWLLPDLSALWPLLLAISLALLWLGLRSLTYAPEPLPTAPGGGFGKAWLAATALAIAAILAHILMAERYAAPAPLPTLKYTKALLALPPLMALAALGLARKWNRLPLWLRAATDHRFFTGGQGLAVMMVAVPFLLLCALSLLFRPMLYERGLLFAAPYLFLLLGEGIARVATIRWLGVLLALLLVMFHGYSAAAYAWRNVDPLDHRVFAAKLTPRVSPGDLLFLRADWNTAPILYYLPVSRYRLVGGEYEAACARNPDARVWTLMFYDQKQRKEQEMAEALADYRSIASVEVKHARAVLHIRKATAQ